MVWLYFIHWLFLNSNKIERVYCRINQQNLTLARKLFINWCHFYQLSIPPSSNICYLQKLTFSYITHANGYLKIVWYVFEGIELSNDEFKLWDELNLKLLYRNKILPSSRSRRGRFNSADRDGWLCEGLTISIWCCWLMRSNSIEPRSGFVVFISSTCLWLEQGVCWEVWYDQFSINEKVRSRHAWTYIVLL